MKNIQAKVKAFSTERGYDSETLEQKFLLLIEEVGEFAKATRKEVGIQVGKHSKESHLAEEANERIHEH